MSMLGFSCTVMNTWEGELVYVFYLGVSVLPEHHLTAFADFSFKLSKMEALLGLYTASSSYGLVHYASLRLWGS